MMIRLVAVAFALLGIVSLVRADIPGPGPRPRPPIPQPVPDKSVPLVMETVDGQGPAKLIIPKQFAGQMKAAIDMNSTDAVADAPTRRLPAILAGVFLTLSLTFTGLFLVRSHNILGMRTAVLILASIVLLGLGSALLWANAPAPRPVPVADNSDRVIIEIVDQGNAVKFIVPKNRLVKLVGNQPRPVPLPAPGAPVNPIGKPEVKPLPAPVKPINGAAAPAQPPVGIAVPLIDPPPQPAPGKLPEKE